jgi:hypothetical protein
VAYRKGESGNVNGRPVGAVNKLTREMNRLAVMEGPDIVARVIEQANLGDPQCRALFFKHIAPKSRLIDGAHDLPPMTTIEGASERIAAINAKLEKGELGVDEAQALIGGAQAYVEARRSVQLEAEVEQLRETVQRLTVLVEQRDKT